MRGIGQRGGNGQEAFHRLLDKDNGDEAGKALLREPGDVADIGAGVRDHED